MKKFDLPIHNNPLNTKNDLQEAFKQITEPLIPYYSEGKARLHIGNTSASYSDSVAEMEGFSRVLWGMAPLLAGGGDSELLNIYIEGIRNGSNPMHEEYWGNVNDFDQRLVEMAAMGFALMMAPEKLWQPLSEEEKINFSNWLLQINNHKVYDCNWVLFIMMVNIGLKNVGAKYDKEKIEYALNKIEDFYIGEGWYADGYNGHADYYIPFAIHYYCLIYAKIMESEDPERSKLYKGRALTFAKDFINWFAEDGAAIPYGRSQTYRFSQSAFWSAFVFAEVEGMDLGVIKGIILRNLRWWFEKPIFNADGSLTIGYAYPNLIMAENYNSPGSPYWALKTFLILCLQDKHSFWKIEEQALPKLDKICVQQKPHLVICRNEKNGGLLAFNSGHLSTNEHTHTSAKYEKFVYSTAFGFSVPRAEWGLAQGAFDSMLALSEGDNIYRVKRKNEEYIIEDNIIYSKWKPWFDVEVQTFIICGNPYHIRIHCINTARALNTAEGGFALGIENNDYTKENRHEKMIVDNKVLMKSFCGVSGIIDLSGERKLDMVYPNSNTNLMYSRTIIPTLVGEIKPGIHFLASYVYADLDNKSTEEFIRNIPNLEIKGDKINIFSRDKNKIIFSRCFNENKQVHSN